MYTYEEKSIITLQDCYTLLYSFIASRLLERFGEDGERALREGTRRFGRDRAMATRKKHLDAGLKINMLNLFTMSHDLPADPRFKREKQELKAQERVSHTLVCPMADVWAAYGAKHIGRIYCEEFHFACYNTYAYGYTKVNLAKTLTQDGDEYCAFNVVLRPETLPDELKPMCFEEYDKNYVPSDYKSQPAYGKGGFNILSIKLYYYLLEAAVEQLGERGAEAVEAGLEDMARDAACRIKKVADEDGLKADAKFTDEHYPLSLDADSEPMWAVYGKNDARERVKKHFCSVLKKELGL